jgi:hypothetical protein
MTRRALVDVSPLLGWRGGSLPYRCPAHDHLARTCVPGAWHCQLLGSDPAGDPGVVACPATSGRDAVYRRQGLLITEQGRWRNVKAEFLQLSAATKAG